MEPGGELRITASAVSGDASDVESLDGIEKSLSFPSCDSSRNSVKRSDIDPDAKGEKRSYMASFTLGLAPFDGSYEDAANAESQIRETYSLQQYSILAS